jgi:hypothetical protein
MNGDPALMSTTSPPGRRNVVARAWLTGVLLCCDAAVVAIIALVWIAQARGQVTGDDVAVFDMFGVSAAVGVVALAFALAATIAVARRRSGRGAAAVAWALGWLRLAGVVIATVAIAVVVGIDAVVGLAATFVVALAILDALVGLVVAGSVRRLARS